MMTSENEEIKTYKGDERKQSEIIDRDKGLRDGYEDAQRMGYDELKRVANIASSEDADEEEAIKQIRNLPLYSDLAYEIQRGNEGFNVDEGVYLPAWAEGVLKFWREAKSKI